VSGTEAPELTAEDALPSSASAPSRI